MMKSASYRFLLAIWCFVIALEGLTFAQTPDIVVVGQRDGQTAGKWWLKRFDANGVEDLANWNLTVSMQVTSNATGVAVDGESGVFVAGTSNNGVSNGNTWHIKKYDATGVEDLVTWDKEFPGGNSHAIAVDASGNVYASGAKHSGGSTFNDWWLKKFDASGIEDTDGWNKVVDGGAYHDNPYVIKVDSAGDVYVAGLAFDQIAASTYGWLIHKYSPNGSLLWAQRFSLVTGRARDLAFDSLGNVYVVGSKNETSTHDWWLKKFSAGGTEDTDNWDLTFSNNAGPSQPQSVAVDSMDNVLVAGSWHNGTDRDWMLKKFDANGIEDTQNWNLTFDSGLGDDQPNSVAIDMGDNVFVVGTKHNGTDVDWWLKKFDANGNEDITNWNGVYGGGVGDDRANCVVHVSASSTIIAQETDLDLGESVTLEPGGDGGDETADAAVTVTNSSGDDNSVVTVEEGVEAPEGSGFGLVGVALSIDTTMADGEFFMTVTLPITLESLGGANPLLFDLAYFDVHSGQWNLAVEGNTANSPGHASVFGDRFVVMDTVLPNPSVPSGDLGDYGVFWNSATQKGFVWANVDHTTIFSPGLQGMVPYGCGLNPVTSLVPLAGGPSLGTTLTVGLDDPAGVSPTGSVALLLASLAPDPSFPCGTPLPGYGMAGPTGELLVGVFPPNPVAILGPVPWTGPGSPAAVDVPIPNEATLLALDLFLQGVMANVESAKLTEALQVTIGS